MSIIEKLKNVPHKPGVYQMLDAANHVIYIGKAKDLYNRLASYFIAKSHDTKTTAMLCRVADFEYFVCKTENDAIGSEANMINRHKPHYNILLKDNKSFPYIVVTDDGRVEITRRLNRRGKYFGPYYNGIWARGLIDTIYDIFGVRGTADASTVADIKKFLSGERDFDAREVLTKKMENASELQQFELAIRYRNGIAFLDKLKERTISNVSRDVNCDVFGYASGADIFVVSVINVRAGKLIGVQNFTNRNDAPTTDDEKIAEFIAQYYLQNKAPSEIISGAGASGLVFNCAKNMPPPLPTRSLNCPLNDGARATENSPDAPAPAQKTKGVKIGYKKRLLEMAFENAHEYLSVSVEKIKNRDDFTVGACAELARILGSGELKRIECYDISHFAGEDVVGSMVVFIDGVADKKSYRKFKIRGRGRDDLQSLREVLTRRFKNNWDLPDLVVIDGGRGQLSATADLCRMPVVAFGGAADDLFLFDRVINLPRQSYALRLLQRARDEAHRFANAYRVGSERPRKIFTARAKPSC